MDLFVADFNPRFTQLVKEKISEALSISNSPEYQLAVEQLLPLSGSGKRIRPYLASIAFDNRSSLVNQEKVFYIMAGIELFHLFALVARYQHLRV